MRYFITAEENGGRYRSYKNEVIVHGRAGRKMLETVGAIANLSVDTDIERFGGTGIGEVQVTSNSVEMVIGGGMISLPAILALLTAFGCTANDVEIQSRTGGSDDPESSIGPFSYFEVRFSRCQESNIKSAFGIP